MRIIQPALRLARFLSMLFHLMNPSLCLVPADVNVLVRIGTVWTVSTTHLNFCQRLMNRHTIIDSHCASSSSEPLDTLFVPIRIIMLENLLGFISSTIRYRWAVVAPPKVITVVIQDVLKFWRTLTKLSPMYQMGCPERRLSHVYRRTSSRSIKAGSRISIRNSCEVILHLVVLLQVKHSGPFLHWHFLHFPLKDAPPLSDLVREASGAPSGTAPEEHPLQVWFFLPLSLMLVVPVAP